MGCLGTFTPPLCVRYTRYTSSARSASAPFDPRASLSKDGAPHVHQTDFLRDLKQAAAPGEPWNSRAFPPLSSPRVIAAEKSGGRSLTFASITISLRLRLLHDGTEWHLEALRL